MLDTSPIHIGAGAFIGPGTCLSCAGHSLDEKQRVEEGIGTSAPIILEENVWLGANCTVCGGVTIGKGSVIGAGSVVTRDTVSYTHLDHKADCHRRHCHHITATLLLFVLNLCNPFLNFFQTLLMISHP